MWRMFALAGWSIVWLGFSATVGEDRADSVLSTRAVVPYLIASPEVLPNASLELKVVDSQDAETIALLEFYVWSKHFDTKVYNPYNKGLIPASYNIAVFDDKHRHVGNVFPVQDSGSRRTVTSADWKGIAENYGLGRRIPIRNWRVHRPWLGDSVVLSCGAYELQVIANSMYFSNPPPNVNGTIEGQPSPEWPDETVNADAWRSNRVRVEIP